MRITKVVYRRVKNLGNYENEALEASAAVDEGESPAQVARTLRAWVDDQLDGPGHRRVTAQGDGWVQE